MKRVIPASISDLSVANIVEDSQSQGCRLCRSIVYCEDPQDIRIYPCDC